MPFNDFYSFVCAQLFEILRYIFPQLIVYDLSPVFRKSELKRNQNLFLSRELIIITIRGICSDFFLSFNQKGWKIMDFTFVLLTRITQIVFQRIDQPRSVLFLGS